MAELFIKTEDGKELPLWIDGVYTIETEDSILKNVVLDAIVDDGTHFSLKVVCEFGDIAIPMEDIKRMEE